jgi:hypothetical protein
VIHVALTKDRFDHVIDPLHTAPARKTRYGHSGLDAIRKRLSHIREYPLDAEIRTLWTPLVECHLHYGVSSPEHEIPNILQAHMPGRKTIDGFHTRALQ